MVTARPKPVDGDVLIDPDYQDNDGHLYLRGHLSLEECATAWEKEVGEKEGWAEGPVEHRWAAWRLHGVDVDGRPIRVIDERKDRFPRSFPVTICRAGRLD